MCLSPARFESSPMRIVCATTQYYDGRASANFILNPDYDINRLKSAPSFVGLSDLKIFFKKTYSMFLSHKNIN